jgi:2-polyprenylphenol 6-hydroxylase
MSDINTNVIIIGGGLVGASLALALARTDISVVLIEAKSPAPIPADDSWDNRVYAINAGATLFLQQLDVWPLLDQQRIAPIEAMQVWGDDGAEIHFNAHDTHAASLGCIVEGRALQQALLAQLPMQPQVQLICPAACESLTFENGKALLTLVDGRTVAAPLIVGADGVHSWVREQAGMEVSGKSYHQSGVVANFSTEKSHGHVARQWFLPEGVLAWLPLPGNRLSMVWSLNNNAANELLALDTEALTIKVTEAGKHTLGGLKLITPAAAFPLSLSKAKTLVKPHVALVGDAAHAVHPLAGQGVNLGFQDARVLAQVLAARAPHESCGDYALLRRYERARKEDIMAMQWTTDGLQQLFAATNPAVKRLRNMGLAFTDRQSWLKRQLIRHAMR